MSEIIATLETPDGELTVFSNGDYLVVEGDPNRPAASTYHRSGHGPYRTQLLVQHVIESRDRLLGGTASLAAPTPRSPRRPMVFGATELDFWPLPPEVAPTSAPAPAPRPRRAGRAGRSSRMPARVERTQPAAVPNAPLNRHTEGGRPSEVDRATGSAPEATNLVAQLQQAIQEWEVSQHSADQSRRFADRQLAQEFYRRGLSRHEIARIMGVTPAVPEDLPGRLPLIREGLREDRALLDRMVEPLQNRPVGHLVGVPVGAAYELLDFLDDLAALPSELADLPQVLSELGRVLLDIGPLLLEAVLEDPRLLHAIQAAVLEAAIDAWVGDITRLVTEGIDESNRTVTSTAKLTQATIKILGLILAVRSLIRFIRNAPEYAAQMTRKLDDLARRVRRMRERLRLRSPSHVQNLIDGLMSRFPLLRDSGLRALPRRSGPGMFDERMRTGGGFSTFEARLRDGRRVQIDDIRPDGVIHEVKIRELGSRQLQRELRGGPALREREIQMQRQSQFITENRLPDGEWETNSPELYELLVEIRHRLNVRNITLSLRE